MTLHNFIFHLTIHCHEDLSLLRFIYYFIYCEYVTLVVMPQDQVINWNRRKNNHKITLVCSGKKPQNIKDKCSVNLKRLLNVIFLLSDLLFIY